MTNEKLKKARERVKKKKEFYSHLSTYVVMGIFFFVLNAVTAFGSWWFHWPLLGWGIGVLFHYFDVFGMPGVGEISEEWEAREIEAEMRRMQGNDAEDTDELELKEMQKEKADKKRWDDSELV